MPSARCGSKNWAQAGTRSTGTVGCGKAWRSKSSSSQRAAGLVRGRSRFPQHGYRTTRGQALKARIRGATCSSTRCRRQRCGCSLRRPRRRRMQRRTRRTRRYTTTSSPHRAQWLRRTGAPGTVSRRWRRSRAPPARRRRPHRCRPRLGRRPWAHRGPSAPRRRVVRAPNPQPQTCWQQSWLAKRKPTIGSMRSSGARRSLPPLSRQSTCGWTGWSECWLKRMRELRRPKLGCAPSRLVRPYQPRHPRRRARAAVRRTPTDMIPISPASLPSRPSRSRRPRKRSVASWIGLSLAMAMLDLTAR